MTLVLDKLRSLLPLNAKPSPSGWISFNAPCCANRGHKPDRRKRGGVKIDSGFIFNCFNCKFSTSWQPGRAISPKLKTFCSWLGADDDDMKQLVFEALKTESPEYVPTESTSRIVFEDKKLPDGAYPIKDWIEEELDLNSETALAYVVEYIVNRGFNPTDEHFYWTPLEGLHDRVILPFRFQNRVTGYTARKVSPGKPKYLSEQHPHFVFNADRQNTNQRFVFVCEGPFDALATGGVALLTNSIHEQQAKIINQLGKEVIVIPDQDRAGTAIIKHAVDFDWAVAFPNWCANINDANDAVNEYGELFVLVDAIQTAQRGSIKCEIAKKNMLKRIKESEE